MPTRDRVDQFQTSTNQHRPSTGPASAQHRHSVGLALANVVPAPTQHRPSMTGQRWSAGASGPVTRSEAAARRHIADQCYHRRPPPPPPPPPPAAQSTTTKNTRPTSDCRQQRRGYTDPAATRDELGRPGTSWGDPGRAGVTRDEFGDPVDLGRLWLERPYGLINR